MNAPGLPRPMKYKPQAPTSRNGAFETTFQKLAMPKSVRSSASWRKIVGSGIGRTSAMASTAASSARASSQSLASREVYVPRSYRDSAKSGWNGMARGSKVRSMTALLQKAKAYLDARRGERVTLGELAHAVDVSPFHLQRRFQQAFGVSPRWYQDAYRVEAVRYPLLDSHRPAVAPFHARLLSKSRHYDTQH